jgi:hypothetical protein
MSFVILREGRIEDFMTERIRQGGRAMDCPNKGEKIAE